jgi:hypothetical protein
MKKPSVGKLSAQYRPASRGQWKTAGDAPLFAPPLPALMIKYDSVPLYEKKALLFNDFENVSDAVDRLPIDRRE